MTHLDEYARIKDNFSRINDTLWPVLERMPGEQAKPIHRVNDTMLLLLSVFAFETVCWECIREVKQSRRQETYEDKLIPALKEAARVCGAPPQMTRKLRKLYPVMNIRHLYTHGAGYRRVLTDPGCLLPKTLRAYGFETDQCQGCADECDHCTRTDLDTQWWPLRSLPARPGAFTNCVAVLDELTGVIVKHLAVDSE